MALLVLVVAACAGSDPALRDGAAQAGSGDESTDGMLICEMERPTGSNIAEKVCRRATLAEMRRMRTQDMLKAPTSAPKRSWSGGAGQ